MTTTKPFMSRVQIGQAAVRGALGALTGGLKKPPKQSLVSADAAASITHSSESAAPANESSDNKAQVAPKQAFTSPTSGLKVGDTSSSSSSSPSTAPEKPLNDSPLSGEAKAKAVKAQPSYLGYLSGVVSSFWPSSTPAPPAFAPVKKPEEK